MNTKFYFQIFLILIFSSELLYARQVSFSDTVSIEKAVYQQYPISNFTGRQFVKSINFDFLNAQDRLEPGDAYKIKIVVPPGTVSMSVSGVATMDGGFDDRPIYATVEGDPAFLCEDSNESCQGGVAISYPPFKVGNSGFNEYIHLSQTPLRSEKQMSFIFYQGLNAAYDFALQSAFRMTYVIEDFSAYNQWIGNSSQNGGDNGTGDESHSLIISPKPIGGTITSSNINCGSEQVTGCSASYVKDTQLTLTANPITGYTFSKWSGDCGTGNQPSIRVSMDSDKVCSATFTENEQPPSATTVTLRVAHPNEKILVFTEDNKIICGMVAETIFSKCQAEYNTNENVLLETSTDKTTGLVFSNWTGDCGQSNDNPLSLVMDGNKTCGVSYDKEEDDIEEPSSFSLTIDNPSNKILVTTDQGSKIRCGASTANDCQAVYNANDHVVLRATATSDDLSFVSWTGDCEANGTDNPLSLTMDSDKTCGIEYAGNDNEPPVALFTVEYDKLRPERMFLDATASYDPEGQPLEYYWSSSNKQLIPNEKDTAISFSHREGVYAINLLVVDSAGLADTTSQVIDFNNPLQPKFSGSYIGSPLFSEENTASVARGFEINLVDESITTDQTPIVERLWSNSGGYDFKTAENGKTASIRFPEVGAFSLTLLISDEKQRTNAISKVVKVLESQPPVIQSALATPRTEGKIGGSKTDFLTVILEAEAYDPDGGEVKYSWSSEGICSGGNVCVTEGNSTQLQYEQGGEYLITLKVTDEEQSSITEIKKVKIKEPSLPVVSGIQFSPQINVVGDKYVASAPVLNLSANAQSQITKGEVVEYQWLYKSEDSEEFTPFAQGKSVDFDASRYGAGSYVFLLRVTDNFGLVQFTGTAAITFQNIEDYPSLGDGTALETNSLERTANVVSATFSGGVRKEGKFLKSGALLQDSDEIEIIVHVQVVEDHVGEAADIVSIVEYEPENVTEEKWYMTAQDENVIWDSEQQLVSLFFSEPIQTLNTEHLIQVFQGQLIDFPGDYTISSGYQLKNGNFVFNQTPISFTVQDF